MSSHRCRAKMISWQEIQGRGLLVYIRYIVNYESKCAVQLERKERLSLPQRDAQSHGQEVSTGNGSVNGG